jgi:hypothetical protein
MYVAVSQQVQTYGIHMEVRGFNPAYAEFEMEATF